MRNLYEALLDTPNSSLTHSLRGLERRVYGARGHEPFWIRGSRSQFL